MSSHLPILREMFPATLLLNVEQVASVLAKSPKTISNWFYKDTLPFKVIEDPDGFKVSILELAAYLDSSLSDSSDFKHTPKKKRKTEEFELPVLAPVKIGRPRGTKRLDALFAAKLSFACMGQLANNTLTDMYEEVDKVVLNCDNKHALAEFSEVKNQLLDKVVKARSELSALYLSLSLDKKEGQSVSSVKPSKSKI